jgi:outer membrane protein TolC
MSRPLFVRIGLAVAFAFLAATAHGQPGSTAAPEVDSRLSQPLTLTDCIAIALENNFELRIARLDRSATHTTVSEAYGAFWPVIGITAERTNTHFFGEFQDKTEYFRNGHAEVSQLAPIGTQLLLGFDTFHAHLDPDLTDTPARAWTFGIRQPLLRGAGWRANTAGVKGAGIDTQVSNANLEKTRLGIVQQVKAAYYEVIRQNKLVEVNNRAVERDQQLVAQSTSKLEAGLGTKRDVLSAEIQREQDRGTLVDSQTGEEEALDVLARVMGLTIGTHHIAVAEHDVDLDSIPIHENAWVEKSMGSNPTVQAAQLQVERSRLDMQVAGNARLPQLDFSATYNSFNDPDLNELLKDQNKIRVLEGKEPKDLKFTANEGWQTLLTFSYPLGNKPLGAAYQRARLVHQQSLRLLEDTQRQVTLEVRSATRALENNIERLGILKKNIEGARNKLEFASVNFQLGRASNLDVTDAQKDLLDAETDYINEVIDTRVQISKLEALLGGSID